jgi:hypothetical protein
MSYVAQPPRSIVAPLLHRCIPPSSPIHKHVANDWIIVCWLFLFVTMLALFGSVAVLIYYAAKHNRNGIYNYSTG